MADAVFVTFVAFIFDSGSNFEPQFLINTQGGHIHNI